MIISVFPRHVLRLFYVQTMLQDNGEFLEWFAGGLAFHTAPCSILLVVLF